MGMGLNILQASTDSNPIFDKYDDFEQNVQIHNNYILHKILARQMWIMVI